MRLQITGVQYAVVAQYDDVTAGGFFERPPSKMITPALAATLDFAVADRQPLAQRRDDLPRCTRRTVAEHHDFRAGKLLSKHGLQNVGEKVFAFPDRDGDGEGDPRRHLRGMPSNELMTERTRS